MTEVKQVKIKKSNFSEEEITFIEKIFESIKNDKINKLKGTYDVGETLDFEIAKACKDYENVNLEDIDNLEKELKGAHDKLELIQTPAKHKPFKSILKKIGREYPVKEAPKPEPRPEREIFTILRGINPTFEVPECTIVREPAEKRTDKILNKFEGSWTETEVPESSIRWVTHMIPIDGEKYDKLPESVKNSKKPIDLLEHDLLRAGVPEDYKPFTPVESGAEMIYDVPADSLEEADEQVHQAIKKEYAEDIDDDPENILDNIDSKEKPVDWLNTLGTQPITKLKDIAGKAGAIPEEGITKIALIKLIKEKVTENRSKSPNPF